jgi:hypothetical protein
MSTPASSIPATIRDRTSAPAQPRVWTPEDFADLGPRTAVDQALHRLVASRSLRRIARSFYDLPQDNRLTGKPTYHNPRDAQRRDRVVHRQYQLLIAAKLNPAIVQPLLGEAQTRGMESSLSAMACWQQLTVIGSDRFANHADSAKSISPESLFWRRGDCGLNQQSDSCPELNMHRCKNQSKAP